MSVQTSVLHQLYEQQDLARFRAFLSGVNVNASGSRKGKESAATVAGPGSYGGASGLSRSPRFGELNSSHAPNKEEVSARDRFGRTVLHLLASKIDPPARDERIPNPSSLDFLEALLRCPSLNVNLQDRENGWTALHRAAYAGNLAFARRLLQHTDTSTSIRDNDGLTAFDLLNSTLLGTNPMDTLDNMPAEDQSNAICELVTWGANRNFVLGLQGDSERTFAERVPLHKAVPTYKKPSSGAQEDVEDLFSALSVTKIAMEKLHSGILTDEHRGNFRLCGFGSTTGRLGLESTHPQFSFEPVKGFEGMQVRDFALGQDHTIACTAEGNLYTFGLNAFGVLGYEVEAKSGRGGLDDELVQAQPKRLFGVFKKETVKGVAASRYHSAAFTEDALYTWGKNNGQLGYSSSATPLQAVPRRVSAVDKPVKQLVATEVATVCLMETGEVLILYRDTHFRITFPMTRLPVGMQPYRPPSVSSRPVVTKVAGSGTTFIAITSMGDLFAWQLSNPALEPPSSTPNNMGREIKPYRVWEERKTFTACTDAAIANDTIIISTRSGHVFISAKRKELTSVKGFELRNGSSTPTATASTNKRGFHKFTRVSNLQRVVQVAVSSSGGFGAIRRDAPLLPVPPTGLQLSESLLKLLPHYRRLEEAEALKRTLPPLQELPNSHPPPQDAGDEDEDDVGVQADIANCLRLCRIVESWDATWAIPLAGSDLLLGVESASFKVPVHSAILIARSRTVSQLMLKGVPWPGLSYSQTGTPVLAVPKCGHITLLLLLHYLYSDVLLALFDGRIFRKVDAAFPHLHIQPSEIKSELRTIGKVLELDSLLDALDMFGKATPRPTLLRDSRRLLESSEKHDVVLLSADADFPCHSAVLRATCPFFEAIFSDPDWYDERMQGAETSQPLRVDLSHFSSEPLQLIIEDLYSDNARSSLQHKVYEKPEDRLNFLLTLLAMANELLLDRLKATCASLIRPFINLNTVCALLCEAIFYEAESLQICCMQYIACNIETMLEQRLLDILPVDALERLASFCRKRQLDRLPRTARSGPALKALQEKYADFLLELDIPRATGGYRRYSRTAGQFSKSPKLSPATFASSLRLSPNLSCSPPANMTPIKGLVSPALTATSVPSPTLRPASAHDHDGDTFDMDDLSLDDSGASRAVNTGLLSDASQAPVAAGSAGWLRTTKAHAPATSLKDIMAQETRSVPASPIYTVPRRTSGAHPTAARQVSSSAENASSPLGKLSQRERKRQMPGQPQSSGQASPSMSSEKTSPWRPVMPAAWKPPTEAQDKPMAALNTDLRNAQPPATSRSMSGTQRFTDTSVFPNVQAAVGGQRNFPKSATQRGDGLTSPGSNLVNATSAVITPTRMPAKRTTSGPGMMQRTAESRAHETTPWVNYTSTVMTPTADLASNDNRSFATIQTLQSNEREALVTARKGVRSLKEIQEEEDAQRKEAEFLTWFEEESKRTRDAQGGAETDGSEGKACNNGRGGHAGRGARGRSGARGGGGNRGRGRGAPPQKTKEGNK